MDGGIPKALTLPRPLNSSDDVLFFNGSLIYGSYPNTSRDRFRRAFICHYLPRSSQAISSWFKPVLDFAPKEVPVEDAGEVGPFGTSSALDSSAF